MRISAFTLAVSVLSPLISGAYSFTPPSIPKPTVTATTSSINPTGSCWNITITPRTTTTYALPVPSSVTLWGQCGGISYTGPTVCTYGSYCHTYNDWYHQCIPGPTTASSSTTAPPVIRTVCS